MDNRPVKKKGSNPVKVGLIALGLLFIAQIAMLILKLTHVINMAWPIALIPLWIFLMFIIAVIITAIVIVTRETNSVVNRDKEKGKKKK